MLKQIKRVQFANNNYSLSWLEIDVKGWVIVDACGAGRHLIGRACRLADRGMKLEYRNGSTYTQINAAVEMMG